MISFICMLMRYYAFSIDEFLIEWLTLNCDGRNSSTQTFLKQLKTSLHSNTNNNSNDHDLRKVNLVL